MTNADPEALRHYFAEHVMYRVFQAWQAPHHYHRDAPLAVRNALIESFALSVRCLLGFLCPQNARPDDRTARDYGFELNALPPVLEEVLTRTHKEIVHLTTRAVEAPELKQWNFAEVLGPLGALLGEFIDGADLGTVDVPSQSEIRHRCMEYDRSVSWFLGPILSSGATMSAGPSPLLREVKVDPVGPPESDTT